jgi:hypothetical protein
MDGIDRIEHALLGKTMRVTVVLGLANGDVEYELNGCPFARVGRYFLEDEDDPNRQIEIHAAPPAQLRTLTRDQVSEEVLLLRHLPWFLRESASDALGSAERIRRLIARIDEIDDETMSLCFQNRGGRQSSENASVKELEREIEEIALLKWQGTLDQERFWGTYPRLAFSMYRLLDFAHWSGRSYRARRRWRESPATRHRVSSGLKSGRLKKSGFQAELEIIADGIERIIELEPEAKRPIGLIEKFVSVLSASEPEEALEWREHCWMRLPLDLTVKRNAVMAPIGIGVPRTVRQIAGGFPDGVSLGSERYLGGIDVAELWFVLARFLDRVLADALEVVVTEVTSSVHLGPTRSVPETTRVDHFGVRGWYSADAAWFEMAAAWDDSGMVCLRDSVNNGLFRPDGMTISRENVFEVPQRLLKEQLKRLGGTGGGADRLVGAANDVMTSMWGMANGESPHVEASQKMGYLDSNGVLQSFASIGTGFGHVMPCLIALFGSSGRLTTIEEPEAHLNPRQAFDFADAVVFVLFGWGKGSGKPWADLSTPAEVETADRERSRNARKQQAVGEYRPVKEGIILLETHSESLVLRVLRRLREMAAEGRDFTDEVQAIHVQNEDSESSPRIIVLEVDEDGEWTAPWPDDFFRLTDDERL